MKENVKLHDLRIGDKVMFNTDGKKIKAEVIALCDKDKCHKIAEVCILLSQKITGNVSYIWCQTNELSWE